MTTITTAVPAVSFSTSGLDVPDEADILAGRLTDLANAIGTSMSKDLTTPQGQIAISDTAIIADKNNQLLAIVNQINPDISSGRFQDAIGRIYFIDRISATGTTVTANCTGLVGKIIPAGSLAQDSSGYIYESVDSGQIGADGSVLILFKNRTTGPIPCPSGALNQIYQSVDGWSGISNTAPGVLGNDVESRSNFEVRRRQSVARNSRNQDASVLSALLATSGVLDAYVWSNRTAATVNKGTTNYPVLAHSIFISVYGGADADVAQAIFSTYNPGANLNGTTHYTVYDNVNYMPPYPTYDMQWLKASPTRVYFKIQIDSSLNPPSDITTQVKNMVISVFNGEYEGIGKARIGATINSGKYYAPIISINPDTVGVLLLQVSLNGTTYTSSVTMGIDQVPTIQASDITVTLV
ncbi:TPA: baseplate J/gp47 family protein [Enterobacter asburiae]|nr:baseplate J/gp47 family protein [Enterobacter asburiae]HCR2223643.1 baseplate J/gp47 family protein [Enterobacter asburiae]